MSVYHFPIIVAINSDSPEEARKALDDWADEIEMDMMPIGTESVDHCPEIEQNDEGQRLVYLPAEEEDDPSEDEESYDDSDDFNDAEEDF